MRSETWLADQLPAAMNDDDFLMRFLRIFQTVSDSLLDQIDTLPHMFDPTVAPDRMLQQMAHWLGIDWMDEDLDIAHKRRVIAGYSSLVRRRGTVGGLRDLLVLLGGTDVQVVDGAVMTLVPLASGDDDPVVAPLPHVWISMSSIDWLGVRAGLGSALQDEELSRMQQDLIRIVRDELPAAATFEMTIGATTLWPPPDDVVGDGVDPLVGSAGAEGTS